MDGPGLTFAAGTLAPHIKDRQPVSFCCFQDASLGFDSHADKSRGSPKELWTGVPTWRSGRRSATSLICPPSPHEAPGAPTQADVWTRNKQPEFPPLYGRRGGGAPIA